MLSLTFTDGAVYSLIHFTALTWVIKASTSCIPQAQHLLWLCLHFPPKAHLSYTPHKRKELLSSPSMFILQDPLPSFSVIRNPGCDTCAFWDPKSRLESPQSLQPPCLGGPCNIATIPAALSHRWDTTRWPLWCCPFYPPQHGSLGGKRKTPARDHHIFHTQSNQQQVFEHQWAFWTLP